MHSRAWVATVFTSSWHFSVFLFLCLYFVQYQTVYMDGAHGVWCMGGKGITRSQPSILLWREQSCRSCPSQNRIGPTPDGKEGSGMYGINFGLVRVKRGPSIGWRKLAVSTLEEWINQGQVGRRASARRNHEIQKRDRASTVKGPQPSNAFIAHKAKVQNND